MTILKRLCIFVLIGVVAHVIKIVTSDSEELTVISQIEVTNLELEAIKQNYKNTFDQFISDQSLALAVNKKVNEKILINEAIRLGIHKHDAVIKERVAKNLEFLSASKDIHIEGTQLVSSMIAKDVVVHRRLLERMSALILSLYSQTEMESINEEVYAFYLNNQSDYVRPKRYKIKHRYQPRNDDVHSPNHAQLISPNTFYSRNNLLRVLPPQLVDEISLQNMPVVLAQFEGNNGVHFVEILDVAEQEPKAFDLIKATVKQDYLSQLEEALVADYIRSIKPYYDIRMGVLDDSL